MGVQDEHLLFIISRQKSRSKEHAIRCALSHAMHCKGECLLNTSTYDILQITALLQSTNTTTVYTPKASGTSLTSTFAEQGVLCCAYLDFWQDDSVVGKGHGSQGSQSIESFVSTGPRNAIIFRPCLHSLCIVVVAPCTIFFLYM